MVILALGLRLSQVFCMYWGGVIIFVSNVSVRYIKMCKALSLLRKSDPSSCDPVWRFSKSRRSLE